MRIPVRPGISDELWARVAPLIPSPQRDPQREYRRRAGSGRKPLQSRRVFEAMVYALRTGIAWKALPKSVISSPSAVHRYFVEWTESGLFHKIWESGLAQCLDLAGIAWRGHAGREESGAGAPALTWEPVRDDTASHEPDSDFGSATDAGARGKWIKVSAKFREDVLLGVYGRDLPLPSQKVLVHRYGISYPTLKKCLEALQGDGLITAHRKGFVVPSFGHGSQQSRIVLVCRSMSSVSHLPGLSALDESLYRLLESECLKLGMALDILSTRLTEDGGYALFEQGSTRQCRLKTSSSVRGYVCAMSAPGDLHIDLLATVRATGKPVALVDQIGAESNAGIAKRFPTIRTYTSRGGTRPGRDMARYLLSLGHRTIAYFSPFHDDSWSVNRCRGMAQEFAAAGILGGVKEFVRSEETHDPDNPGFWDYKERGVRNFKLAGVLDALKSWAAQVPASLAEKTALPVCSWLEIACAIEETRTVVCPFFEQALADKSITAWVVSGDAIALFADDFLKERGVAVPHQLSLASFDNTLEASRRLITSYSFGESMLAASVVNHILRPLDSRDLIRKRVVQIPGTVVERASTGRVR